MSETPELSIVIVNWNSSGYLRECLASIVSETHSLSYEIVVVDNGSTHDDLDQLAAESFSFRLIRNGRNVGFAKANNIGFHYTRAPFVLFLNPDTRILGTAFERMLSVLKLQPDAGIVGCRLLNSDLTVQMSSVRRYPTILNQALGTNLLYARFPTLPMWGLRPLFQATDEMVSVEAVSGACLAVRRSVFEQVGLFSEEYFMYAEDTDLCYKVAREGWQCYYCGGAMVIHHGGGSSSLQRGSWSDVAQCTAKHQFLRKTRGAAYGRLYRFAMATSAALRLLILVGLGLISAAGVRQQRIRAARARWNAIFRWALQPESWNGFARAITDVE
jgi:N-acetylglucosaminyl-diphospho-decaprenol L-rhamnosyltransferase